MRVIAGLARRIPLKVAPGSTARPFLEKARGALFNALADRVEGASVLDLYAGSGALGIEALSRGAAAAVFVERDPGAVEMLRRNLEACRLGERATILARDVTVAVSSVSGVFHLVFVDPPFPDTPSWGSSPGTRHLCEAIAARLAEGGLVVFRYEHDRMDAPMWPGLVLVRDRRYGRSRLCWYGHASGISVSSDAPGGFP